MKLKVRARLLISVMVPSALIAAAPTAAFAQAGPPDSSVSNSEEIIVTATRLATDVQKTPLAINVYGGRALAEQDIHTLNALQTIDPSVQITNATNTPYIAIRGVESTNTTEVGNPSVSVARDGFFVNRPYTLGLSFYDLDRVEVLKGPQGTLFGRNSTGGLINIISAKPKLDSVSGYVTGTIGDYSLYGLEGALNLPLTDTLAIRLSGYGRHRSGYRDVTGIDERGDDDRSASGRAQAYWRPSDAFDVLVEYQRDHLGGVGEVQAIGPIGEPFTGDSKSFVGYQPGFNHVDANRVTWTANAYNLPFDGTLTYTGGRDLTTAHSLQDTSGTNRSGQFVQTQFNNDQHVETWNHEVRYATSQANPFYVQFGGFFFSEHNDPMAAGQIVQSGAFAGQHVIEFLNDVKANSRAAFGQASYRFGAFTFTAGARYSWDHIQRIGESVLHCDAAGIPPFLYGALNCSGTPPVDVTPANGRQNESKLTYRTGVDWQVSPTSLFYAKYDTGYKPGGFSTDPDHPDDQFGPETVTALEVGSKNRFFDNKLTLNGDVFYQVLNGFQATLPSSLGSATINAGKTRTWGIELAAVARVAPLTRLDANLTYLHGRFSHNIADVGDPNGGLVSIAGNNLPNAPDLVITGGASQDFPIGSAKIMARLDGRYSSRIFYDVFNYSDTSSSSYVTGDFSLAYEPGNGKWRVQAYVKNFTDKAVIGRITRTTLITAQTFQFQAPRTVGASLTFNF